MINLSEILLNRKALSEIYRDGKRDNGRGADEYRDITIECGLITKAEGSARVKIGETDVIAGVKMKVGVPYPDSPESGILITNAEFTPIASPEFEPGPPSEESVELARVVDRGIRESQAIELDKLCIIPKEAVWEIWLDLYIFNHRGNLIDACAIAAVAALLTTKIPELDEDNNPIYEKRNTPLPIRKIPITTTIAKIEGKLFVDPDLEEESIMTARLSIATLDNGNISAMQKGGTDGFTLAEIEKCLDIALSKNREIYKKITEAVEKYMNS